MRQKNYIEAEDLLYSGLYGGGIYRETDAMVQDPLSGDVRGGQLSPLLENVITGEQFFARRMDKRTYLEFPLRERILRPPNRKHILWPSDIIDLSQLPAEEKGKYRLFVGQEYVDRQTAPEDRTGDIVLLFPYGGYPIRINGEQKLAEISSEDMNWKNPEVIVLAERILRAIDSLNRDGYIYNDIHPSRFYFDEQGEVYLDYTGLLNTYEETTLAILRDVCIVSQNEYPLEFGEPYIVNHLPAALDFESQNYSLAALLFYLFLGRYAYQGSMVSDKVYDRRLKISEQQYYSNFRAYHNLTVFIYDPADRRNAIGTMYEEKRVNELWEELPEQMKQYFILVLQQGNATREHKQSNPTAGMWLDLLADLGWITEGGEA